MTESGDHAVAISDHDGGDHVVAITSSTTGLADSELTAAYEAVWRGGPDAPGLRGMGLKRLFQRPAVRPDRPVVAAYLAAWYGQQTQDGEPETDGVQATKLSLLTRRRRNRLFGSAAIPFPVKAA
jgi:hypothetical protein